jgi:hypothetical protein
MITDNQIQYELSTLDTNARFMRAGDIPEVFLLHLERGTLGGFGGASTKDDFHGSNGVWGHLWNDLFCTNCGSYDGG